MRILIEVPTYDGRIGRATSESLWRLDRCGHEVDYRARQGYGCAMARNRIAADALNARYDRVMMVDNDIELPQDALRNLLGHDGPVVMGWYLNRYARGERRFTTLYKHPSYTWDMYASDELRALADAGTYEVRVKGGSYGTGFAASPSGNIACWSYRDPTPENTLKVYQGAADYLTAMAEEGADLTSYIIGTINASDPLQSASAKILSADNRWFSGIGYEIRKQLREEMLKTDCEDLKQFAKAMKQCIADGKVCVVGSGEALDRCGITDKHLIG